MGKLGLDDMVRFFDDSYRNYRADQRERPNAFYGWKVHDKFNRPMGTLGEYLDKQEPHVTGNDQYEDSFGQFTINDPPSGEELYIDWKMCSKVSIQTSDGKDI